MMKILFIFLSLYFSPLRSQPCDNALRDELEYRADPSAYPLAWKNDSVIENLHGVSVSDPYRWMEQQDSPDVKEYIKRLNEYSAPYFANGSDREIIRTRLEQIYSMDKYSSLGKYGDFYYYTLQPGLKDQAVIYVTRSLKESGTVLVDPETFTEFGNAFIIRHKPSNDGTICAYGLSQKGSDLHTLKFRKVTGEDYDETLYGLKYSEFSWFPDNSGVFYSAYGTNGKVAIGAATTKNANHSIFFHKLGTSQQDDILVVDYPRNPDAILVGVVTEDGKYLMVEVHTSGKTDIYAHKFSGQNIVGKLNVSPVCTQKGYIFRLVDVVDDSALVMTNYEAPMNKLLRVKLDSEEDSSMWETVVENDEQKKLESALSVNADRILLVYNEDVKPILQVHCFKTGRFLYRIPFEIGSIAIFADRSSPEAFVEYSSFFVQTVHYRLNFAGKSLEEPVEKELIWQSEVNGINEEDFITEQVYYPSTNGTKIPMFITRKKDFIMNGNNPTILTGYGGFAYTVLPGFKLENVVFLQHFNGIIASANIRGGSEYGEQWHIDGMRENKENVFNDFIAAAEYLISKNYTSPQKLAIEGTSNGGLLVAACAQKRPDLYGAVVSRVGVLDMLRFHKFTVGGAWISEYGNPDDATDFQYLYRYSPLHNVRYPETGQWPSTLVVAAAHDDRVVPSHSLKYIARLYEVIHDSGHCTQTNPVLIRIEDAVGHGAGKPTSKQIGELVDLFSFLQRALHIEFIA